MKPLTRKEIEEVLTGMEKLQDTAQRAESMAGK